MILPYSGCFTRRSTRTTTVLSPLSDTTVPVRTRFGISIVSLRLGALGAGALILQRLDPGDRAANDAHTARLFELSGGRLKTQVEMFTLQIAQLLLQRVVGLVVEIVSL